MILYRLWWPFGPTIFHQRQGWKGWDLLKNSFIVQCIISFCGIDNKKSCVQHVFRLHTNSSTQWITPLLQRLKSEAWGYGHRQVVVSRGHQLAAMDLNPELSLMYWELSSIPNFDLECCSVKGCSYSLTLPVDLAVDACIWEQRHRPLGSQVTLKEMKNTCGPGLVVCLNYLIGR